MEVIVSSAPEPNIMVSSASEANISVGSVPEVNITVSGQPVIEIAMQTKVLGADSELAHKYEELEKRIKDLEEATIQPL